MRKKAKSIKPKKERLMPFKEQVRRLKVFLDKEGIPIPAGEVEDFVDPTLHYSENKAALKDMYGIGIAKMRDVDVLIQQAEARSEERSMKAQMTDWHKRAKHTWTPRELVKDPEKADKWFNNPNRYDIVGVDVKEGLAVIKRKKKRKKKKPVKGEKARKLAALKSGKAVKPPKKWFDKMERKVSKQYPTYSAKRKAKIVGGIWSEYEKETKIKIVRKYQ